MFCCHCGYEINEHKIESQSSTFADLEGVDLDTSVKYVCPRCGHLVHGDVSQADVKSLTAACHAELQRSRNDVSRGMSSIIFGSILAVIGMIFLLLSRKVDNQRRVTVTSPEFWVFFVLSVIAVILLVFGSIYLVRGKTKAHKYSNLLNDINNKTFVQ